jgi:hypothetical protein
VSWRPLICALQDTTRGEESRSCKLGHSDFQIRAEASESEQLPVQPHLAEGNLSVFVGRHGAMNPAGRVRCNTWAR